MATRSTINLSGLTPIVIETCLRAPRFDAMIDKHALDQRAELVDPKIARIRRGNLELPNSFSCLLRQWMESKAGSSMNNLEKRLSDNDGSWQ